MVVPRFRPSARRSALLLLFTGVAFAQAIEAPIRQAGRHRAPYLNLSEGKSVITRYRGESALVHGSQMRALSSTTGDFDEDGMPDLVSGFAAAGGAGAITVHRGNVDALWPYGALRGTEPPAFLPDARVFALPEAPDFLAAGDFDADGHWDLVAGRAGGTSLYLLKGDGHGGFAEPERIALPGALTAMTSGEINRADGLTDLMVAITGDAGPQVLVFESPTGALRGKPETFELPAPATSLAVMPLDGGLMNGLAIASGRDLLLIHGRDRQLTRGKADRESVAAATITRQRFDFALQALAVGNFSSPTQDLAALGDDGQIHILERSDANQSIGGDAQFSLMQAGGEGASSRGVSGAHVPTRARAARPEAGQASACQRPLAGAVSTDESVCPTLVRPKTTAMRLRSAIALPASVRNAGAGAKLVKARVAATGRDSLIVIDPAGRQLHVVSHASRDAAATMSVSASLDVPGGAPAAVEPMRINKDALHDLVVLAGAQAAPIVYATGPDVVWVVTNTGNMFESNNLPMLLNFAPLLEGASLEIDFNIPVTDRNRDPITGVFTIQPFQMSNIEALTNLGGAITIDGYTQPGASPNTLAIGGNAHPLIEINGSMAGSGPSGLQLYGDGNTIRGLVLTNWVQAPVSGGGGVTHGGGGIDIESSHNFIEGNFLGIDAGGTFAKPNYFGIFSFGGENGNMIGGTTPQARNIISGNQYTNIAMAQEAVANAYFIQGNYIGTDKTGSGPVGNTPAAMGLDGLNIVLGGTTAGARNVLAVNGSEKVSVMTACTQCIPATGNLIQGNYIGTDATGTVRPLFDSGTGVFLAAANGNTIGGTTPAARNILSGNWMAGVELAGGSENNLVQGNYIGVDVTGIQALGNHGTGVTFGTEYYDQNHVHYTGAWCPNNTIGGEAPGAGNVISNNTGGGIGIAGLGSHAMYNVIAGNLIGTDATGLIAMGNTGDGISMTATAASNTVGGTDPAAANVIAYNTGNGVNIDSGAVVGSNNIIANSIYSNGGTGVRVTTSTNNKVSQNRIYSNGAMGIDIDATGVLANSACQANTSGANLLQNAPVLTAGSGATFVSATATDPWGNTSEFSNCVATTLTGNVLNIAGTLNSKASTAYTIEYFSNAICDASGHGQGQVYLGSSTVTSSGSCDAALGNALDLTKADLAVTNSWTDSSPSINMAVGVSSVVTNAGPAAATGVVWTDVLPAGTNFLAVTATQGTCGFSSGAITCNLGNLPVGGTVSIAASIVATALGNLPNTVSVASSTPDGNTANNSATATATVRYVPILDHLSPASVNVGSPDTALTIVGQGFMPTSVVTYGGVTYPATFNGNWNSTDCGRAFFGGANYCTALTITVPASLLTAVTTVQVAVTGGTARGGIAYLTFSVVTPPVVPGPVTHFVLSGIANPSASGALQMLYVTATDAAGLTVPTYTGTVNLTSTDTAPGVFTQGGASATLVFTAAKHGQFVTYLELQTTGSQYVTATDAANPSLTGALGPINVAYGKASNLAVTGTPQATPPGQPFAVPLGVIVTDAYGNFVPNQTITFTPPASGPSAVLSSTTATTNSQGVASVTATANGISGTYAVGVTYGAGFAGGGPNTDVFLLNNGSGLATLTATAGTPQSTFVGQLFPTQLAATLLDGLGHPISGATVYFNSGGPLIYGATATNASGVTTANANAPSNSTPGLYPIIATVGGLTATFALTIQTPQPVVMTIVAGSPQSAAAGYAFSVPLTVKVTDGWGAVRPGVVVTYIPPTSGASATLSSGIASTDSNGIASLTATANSTLGTYDVVASVGSVSVNFALTNGPAANGPPASITAVAGTPQSQSVTYAFTTAMKVLVKNAGGTALPGVGVTFAAPLTGASGTFAATATVTTDGNGFATAPAFTANTVAGSYNVTATAGTVSTTFALTNASGEPAAMNLYAGNNQNAAVNTAFATALAVQLVDSYGNPVPAGWGVTFFVAPGNSGASGTFASSAAVNTNSNGVATLPTLTANGTTGAFQVAVMFFYSSTQLYQVFSLNNVTALPAAIAAFGGTPQSTPVSTAFAAALSAKVTDAGGNPMAGIAVTFTAPASGPSATLSSATATTNASGIASVTATANGVAGSYSVTAGTGGFHASFSLTNTAPLPAAIATTGGTPQSTAVATAFGTALSVKVTDAATNPISGITVTFTAPASGAGATLSGTTAVTNGSGIASVTATANHTAGAYSITAGAGGFSATFSLTNTPGTATTVTASAGTPQSATVNTTFFTALQATVQDTYGNPISGASVAFTAPGSGASGTFASGSTVTANAYGVATAPAFTANTTAGSYTVTAASGTGSANFSLTNTAAATHFAVVAPASATPNAAFNFTVTAQDAGNNTVTGYAGTVHFTASDTAAALPADARLSAGAGTFSATLKTVGNQSLTATDTVTAGVAGTSGIIVVAASQAVLSIASSHSGSFLQGQQGATFTLTVSNAAGAGATSGTVTVNETPPLGLTVVSMAGTGWTCGTTSCSRSTALGAGSSYPAITVTVNVDINAGTPLVNQASVTGGGAATASATDSTAISPMVGGAAALFGTILSKQGTQTVRVWTFQVGNSGSGAAVGAGIASVRLTQTAGAACMPVISVPAVFPLALGNIPAGAWAQGAVTINFTGCGNAAEFTVLVQLSANGGNSTGSVLRNDEER